MTTSNPPDVASHAHGMESVEPLVQTFLRQARSLGLALAQVNLLDSLASAPAPVAVGCARRLLDIGAALAAVAVLNEALAKRETLDLLYWSGFALRSIGDWAQAGSTLRRLVQLDEGNAPAHFLLALVLYEEGRYRDASEWMRAFARRYPPSDADSLLAVTTALERSDDATAAFEVAAQACANSSDPAMPMEAGRLALKLGQFERARVYLEHAYVAGHVALKANALHALASTQRYASAQHADFLRIRDCVADTSLPADARPSVLSAAGKAYDDIGEFEQAATFFEQSNRLLQEQTVWNGDNFAQIALARPPLQPLKAAVEADFVPVFIVGMPRTGTTLLADLLARHPLVRNRGEMTWIEYLAARLVENGNYDHATLAYAGEIYRRHLRRDDAPGRWYIDKQPFNFYHLDVIAAIFPQAKILHCRRDARDTALSIWMQYFSGDAVAFSSDFGRIAEVMRNEQMLMQRWRESLPIAIHEVVYEELVAKPEDVLSATAAFLQMPAFDFAAATPRDLAIGTSSLWQARQPIYSRAVGHWRNYADWLPELTSRFAEHEST